MGAKDKIQIIESLGLVLVSHNDTLNQESVEKIITGIVCNPFIKDEYNVLIDIRNSIIKITSEEIEFLSNFFYENLKEYGFKKIAILATVIQTSKVEEFIHYFRQSSRYQVFSFADSAVNWLGIPVERKALVKIKLTYICENYLYNKLNNQLKLNYQFKYDYCQPEY